MSIKTIIGIALCILIGIGFVLLLGYAGIEPFTTPYTYVAAWASTFNFQETMSNPASLVTTATATVGGITAVAVPLISKLNTYKNEAYELRNQASTTISQVTAEKDRLIAEATAAKNSLTSANTNYTELQNEYDNYKQEAEALKTQVTSYQAQAQAATAQSTQFIQGLMQAANGALVTGPDGKIYSVLKVPPEIIIK